MAVTIKDLAKATGLGGATISAYLNGVPVRSYNKEKIEKAIKELKYIRNDYARGLKTHESKTIGVLIPELSNTFSTTIISEMEETLREKGYGIIVCDCKTDISREQEALKFMLSKMVDGLIVMPISTSGKALKIATDNNVPTVVIDRMTDSDKVSHIVINNREISKCAVNRLINEGAKKVAHIAGETKVYTAYERHEGYKEALRDAGLSGENLFYCGYLSIEGGYNAVKIALSEHPDIDGMFISNHEMTVGGIIALKEEGIKIGTDLKFICFDSVEISKIFVPKLMTVVQPLKEIGDMAAETILAMIDESTVRNVMLKAVIE